MLTLYYIPRTRSSRPRWMLEELGLPYELVRINPENKPPDYAELHPLGHVPVLKDGDFAMFESAAICMYLAEKDERFVPKAGTAERAHYYQWMLFGVTELEVQASTISGELKKPEAERDLERLKRATASFHRACLGLKQGLGEREYLVGNFSAVDVVVGSILLWARSLNLLKNQTELLGYTERLAARPAAQRARAD